MTSPTEMTANVVVKVGPVKASFAGKVNLSDLDPPNGYRISGEGSGGVAGFAKGGATVKLLPDGPDAHQPANMRSTRRSAASSPSLGRAVDRFRRPKAGRRVFPEFCQ